MNVFLSFLFIRVDWHQCTITEFSFCYMNFSTICTILWPISNREEKKERGGGNAFICPIVFTDQLKGFGTFALLVKNAQIQSLQNVFKSSESFYSLHQTTSCPNYSFKHIAYIKECTVAVSSLMPFNTWRSLSVMYVWPVG